MSILCYHSVDPAWRSPLAVTPEVFRAQCEWFARTRRVVPLDAYSADRRTWRPRPPIALTFDDGFAELADHAFPVLAEHRLPAVVFLVAQTLTPAGQAVDWVDTPPTWPLRTLTVDQVRAARDQGIRFASHSWSHADLTQLTEAECLTDLRTSKELLEDLLCEPVDWLAYPRGRHAAHVRRAAARAGYTRAYSLPEGPERTGQYAVPRVGVFPGNGSTALKLKTGPGYLAVRQSRAWPALKAVVRRFRQ